MDADTILAALPDSPSTTVSLKAVRSGSALSLTFFQVGGLPEQQLDLCTGSLGSHQTLCMPCRRAGPSGLQMVCHLHHHCITISHAPPHR